MKLVVLLIQILAIFPTALLGKSYTRMKTSRQSSMKFSLPAPGKPITIIVHGTRLPAPILLIPGLKQQVLTPPGLHKAQDVGNFYFYTRLASKLSASDPLDFPQENIYLYKALNEIYRARDSVNSNTPKKPAITIITISHGGNVALNAAKKADFNNDTRVLVDRLILLAMPVQKATENYSHSPIFKNIFHLFAPHDMIQILDPQGLYKITKKEGKEKSSFFSQRTFKKPPTNMIQVALTRYGYSLSHIDFITPHFIKHLSAILRAFENPITLKKIPVNTQGIYRLDYKRFLKNNS